MVNMMDKRRRRLASLSLAVALAVPLVSVSGAAAAPATQTNRQASASQELLRKGVREYQRHQYQTAVTTLKQVRTSDLSPAQRKELERVLADAGRQIEAGQLQQQQSNAEAALSRYAAQSEQSRATAAKPAVAAQPAKQSEASAALANYAAQADRQAAAGKSVAPAKASAQASQATSNSKQAAVQAQAQQTEAEAALRQYSAEHPAPAAARQAPAAAPKAAAAAPKMAVVPAASQSGESAERQQAEAERALQRYSAEQSKQAPAPEKAAPSVAPVAVSTKAAPARPAGRPTTAAAPSQTDQAQQALETAASMAQIRRQQQIFEAKSLVDEAQKAQASGDYDQALRLFTRATQLDPSNQAAQAGRQQMATLTGRTTGGATPLSQTARDINIQRDAINFRFQQAISAAQSAIASGDFAAAQRQLEAARLASQQNPAIFSQPEINQFQTQLDNVTLSLQQAQRQAQQAEANRAQAEALRQQMERKKAAAEQNQRAVASLVQQAMQLTEDGQYQAALGVINQILVLDPNNAYAQGAKPLVQDKANFQEQRKYREQFDQEVTQQLNAAEEKKIPYSDIYKMPENWPDIVTMRAKSVKEEQGLSASDEAVRAMLDKRLPEVKFDGVAFSDVIDFFRNVTGANIFVNWRALEQLGINRTAPVTARLHDVKFSKALSMVLQEVSPPAAQLSYAIDEGVITISTKDDLSKNVTTQVYDIRDIIFEVPDFTDAPNFDLSQIGNNSGGRGGGGGGSQNLFQNTNQQQTTPEQAKQERQERMDEITKLIEDTIAPDTWRDVGGQVGSVRTLSGQLIVTQTPDNQAAVRGLLEKLRETRAIEVSIEARFLTVQRNFLEDVGLDVDFAFNRLGKLSSKWGPFVVNQNSADFTQNPSTSAPGSLGSVQQIAAAGGGTGTGDNTQPLSSALSMSGSYGNPFLDDFTVNFLLRATQANQTSTILTAPRVTLFNGQRAYVLVATQRAYVSDLEAVTGTNAVAFNPTVSTVQSGVKLDVQAVVSADRKYVTLTLQPQLATLVDLVNFTFQQLPTNTQNQNNDNVTTIPNVTAGNGTIQQPIIQITQVSTTVMVPDGGTLLLGGQTITGEIEKEQGVPVLSKIPFIKRLFTNRSTAHDDQVLLILVKPTIIIQREQEQKQFPLLSSNGTTNQ